MTTEVGHEPIAKKAGRGLRWSLLGTVVTKCGNFALGIALARILTEEDFGVYAVGLSALYLLMSVNDLGVIAATMHWRGKLSEMAATATTIAAVTSATLYIGFWFAAPAIAGIAKVDEATPVLRLLALIILIDGLSAVRSGALMREFRQDRLVIANLAGLAVNATVAIGLAVGGAGPFSFAGGQVGGALLTGVIVMVAARIPLRFGLRGAVCRRLLWYGVPLTASLGVEAVLVNADYLIIGNITEDVVALGYYLMAFNVSTWAVSVISTAISYVSVSSFSRLAERGTQALSDGVRRTIPLLFTVAVPIAALTMVLATPLLSVVYGPKWEPAGPVLQALAVLTLVRMLANFSLEILMGAGATRSTLWVNLGWGAALIPALVIGTSVDGIRGAAIAHGIVGVGVATPLVLLALHRAGVRLLPIAPHLLRPALGGVLAAGAALLASHLAGEPAGGGYGMLQLALAGTAGLVVYAATAVPRVQLRSALAMVRRDKKIDVGR